VIPYVSSHSGEAIDFAALPYSFIPLQITNCSSKYKIDAHVLHWSDETRDIGVITDKKATF